MKYSITEPVIIEFLLFHM